MRVSTNRSLRPITLVLAVLLGLLTLVAPAPPGNAAAPYTLSASGLAFRAVPFDVQATQHITLTNKTGAAASFSVRFADYPENEAFWVETGVDTVSGATCLTGSTTADGWDIDLAAGRACDITVIFGPVGPGAYAGTLEVDTAPTATYRKDVTLTAIVTQPLGWTPKAWEFGDLTVTGPAVTKTITMKNTSGQKIEFFMSYEPPAEGPPIGNSYETAYAGGTCWDSDELKYHGVLETNATCTAELTLAPNVAGNLDFDFTAIARRYTDNNSSEWMSTQAVPVHVNGVLPTFTVPEQVSFGSVAHGVPTAYKDIKVKNTSPVAQRIGVRFSDDNESVIEQHGTCIFGVAPGKTCTIQVRITPYEGGDLVITMTTFLRKPDNSEWAGTAKDTKLLLTAKYGSKSVGPGNLNFGKIDVGYSLLKVVTVKNTGKGNELIHIDTSSMPFGLSLIDGTSRCDVGVARPVAPGETCFLYVLAEPSVVGEVAGSIGVTEVDLANNEIPGSRRTVKIKMEAVNATFTVAPTDIDFGFLGVGFTRTKTVTVTNTSASPIDFNFSFSSSGSGMFTYLTATPSGTSPCSPGAAIKPNKKCTIEVKFAPGEVTTETGQLTIWPYNQTWRSTVVNVKGVGLVQD
ncbi:choice-of-anchor D domain-containing protein [Nocardioides humilatus]|nr:choice-of-anchor D domain-containing protein [Nocardioides humilatus]